MNRLHVTGVFRMGQKALYICSLFAVSTGNKLKIIYKLAVQNEGISLACDDD